jgi:multidrug efflux pump subunit AcrA (membrane-fusion protein)
VLAQGNVRTRTFPLLVDIDNQDHVLAAGMSARVFVELSDSQTQVLMLPRDAVVQKPDGSRVAWQIVEADDTLKAKPVKLHIGRAQGDFVEVLDSPLQAGNRVVMLGNENLRPNQTVRVETASIQEVDNNGD